jgi:hypothetical protein
MPDEDARRRLLDVAPPASDPEAVLRAVKRRRARSRARLTASALVVIGVAAASATFARGGDAKPRTGSAAPVTSQTAPRRRPACALPAPFTGFAAGTDSARVARSRGSAPTRLVARATGSGSAMSGLRMEVRAAGRTVVARDLGDAKAAGQPIVIEVGDAADDGSVMAPGAYDVLLTATVTGRDECGEQATQTITSRVGILDVL